MAFEILGQHIPAAHTLEALYIVPADKQVVASTLNVCNESLEDAYFYISLAVDGATDADKQYLYYREPIRGYRTYEITRGLTLPPGTHVRVKSTNGHTAFQLFGDVRDSE
jgi:hypothetical protein